LKVILPHFIEKINDSVRNRRPFVIYKKPEKPYVNGLFQKDQKLHEFTNKSEKGFVFSPFNKKKTTIIIPVNASDQLATSWDLNKIPETSTKDSVQDLGEIKEYTNLVSNAIDHINNAETKKIVTSRKELIKINEFNLIDCFGKMLHHYPNAFNYCWFHPATDVWMGATPEKLFSLKKNTLNTVSLAGTKQYQGSCEVAWDEKELEEQKLVTDFIINALHPFSNEIQAESPYSSRAGNLLHLRTEISCKINPKTSIFQLIDAIHPTPAVCGFPRENAIEFLQQNEQYNRAYYSGYLGEYDSENATDLYVNLRCMKYVNNTVSIYVGGGITNKSNPKSEWEETVLKSYTMKRVII